MAPETETPLQPPRKQGAPPLHPNVSCHSFDARCMQAQAQTHTQKQYRPRGPVSPTGLSAFSLLPRHLHTNTVCWGPGTNTRHSTFHYCSLIIVGREAAGERLERRREGAEDRERGRGRLARQSGGMAASFISRPPSLKTHLGPVHAQLKTSLRHQRAAPRCRQQPAFHHPVFMCVLEHREGKCGRKRQNE